jgi:hypothetical protein
MRQVTSKTSRIRRSLLDRLRGFYAVYETTVTDGYREVYGRGPTADASRQSAERNWKAKFSEEPDDERA